jgi:hypothetical protein
MTEFFCSRSGLWVSRLASFVELLDIAIDLVIQPMSMGAQYESARIRQLWFLKRRAALVD